jgi:hypothetical protein
MRTLCLLALFTPSRVFLAPASVATPLRAMQPGRGFARLPLVSMVEIDEAEAYRTLGVTEDATYDEISVRFEELSDSYADDAARLEKVEAAKEKILDVILRKRMEGSMQAIYEGKTAREDIKAPPKTPLWKIADEYRRKMFQRPSPKHALQVFGLLGGLSLAGWIAPNTAGTTLLINTVSAMGFMYNRGEAEIPRDDFGQIGEIRPMKPKPMAFTATITALFWFWGFFKTKSVMAAMVGAPKGLETVVRTTLCSCALILPSLFLKVQWIEDEFLWLEKKKN